MTKCKCGRKKYTYSKMCHKCYYKTLKGKTNPNYKNGRTYDNKCKNCGKHTSKHSQKFCNKCASIGENNPMYNKKHSKETKLIMRLKRLGTKHSLKSRAKMSKDRKGNPVYLHIKLGVTGDTIIKHHIDLDRSNNDKSNLLKMKQRIHTSLHHKAYNYLVKIGKIRSYIRWFAKERGLKFK
jgi:hypothetical protein